MLLLIILKIDRVERLELGYQSEYGLEENVVKQLQDLGYERVLLRNRNTIEREF